eukprot:SAG22_NODE_7801_length_707_cov_1.646382_1_plen_181_part_10
MRSRTQPRGILTHASPPSNGSRSASWTFHTTHYRRLFGEVRRAVDVPTFYDVYRPLLAGWTAQPGGALIFSGVRPLPGLAPLGPQLPSVVSSAPELLLQHSPPPPASAGASGDGPAAPERCDWAAAVAAGLLRRTPEGEVACTAAGPSAGQSTIFSLFDRFLGVDHRLLPASGDAGGGAGC